MSRNFMEKISKPGKRMPRFKIGDKILGAGITEVVAIKETDGEFSYFLGHWCKYEEDTEMKPVAGRATYV